MGAVIMVSAFSGCFITDKIKDVVANKVTEKVIETSTNAGVDVDLDNKQISLNVNGTTTQLGESVSLPAGMNEDVPTYSAGQVTSSSSDIQSGYYYFTIRTTDAYADVENYFNDEITTQGWEISNTTQTASSGKMTIYSATKDDRNLTISLFENKDDSTVTIAVASEQKN